MILFALMSTQPGERPDVSTCTYIGSNYSTFTPETHNCFPRVEELPRADVSPIAAVQTLVDEPTPVALARRALHVSAQGDHQFVRRLDTTPRVPERERESKRDPLKK